MKAVAHDLFPLPPKPPRAKPRVMMHWDDCGGQDDVMGHFFCKKCGHAPGWLVCTYEELRRGMPCPKCNDSDSKGEHSK